MSFRARLALVAAAAVALAVIVASGVVYLVVKDELYSSVDASLRDSMQHIQRGPAFEFPEGPPQPGVFGGYPQAVRQDGVTCCKRPGESLTLPVTQHVLSVARGESNTYYENERVGGNHVRIITFPYQPGYAVQIAQTLDETDPFKTLIQYSSELPPGQSRILREGVPGQAVRTYRVTFQNGQEIARDMLGEDILTRPVDQIVLEGSDGILHGSQVGQASWYDFCRVEGDYAAHLSLPFGTEVTVKNLDNGKTVTVVINDRGPYGVPGRVIDLCDSAFAKIAPLSQGVADVEISW